MATRVVGVNDIQDGHVGLDLECFDRIYLNVSCRFWRSGARGVIFLVLSQVNGLREGGDAEVDEISASVLLRDLDG